MTRKRELWSQQDVDYFIAHYTNTPTAVIAKKLNATDARIWRKAQAWETLDWITSQQQGALF